MNGLYLALGLFLLAVASIIPPPGLSPIIDEAQDIPVIAVRAPDRAVEMGYPRTVYFYEPYVKRHWGYAYAQMVNDSFTEKGLYDYERNRIVSPEEVRAGLIVGYVGRADMGFYAKVSWLKVLFMALGAGLIASAILEAGPRENRVLKPEAEIRA